MVLALIALVVLAVLGLGAAVVSAMLHGLPDERDDDFEMTDEQFCREMSKLVHPSGRGRNNRTPGAFRE